MNQKNEISYLTSEEAMAFLRTTKPSLSKFCEIHGIKPRNILNPGKKASGSTYLFNKLELIEAVENSKISD